jgi:hypothetical protein
VYGPSIAEGKLNFINWLENIQMSEDLDWFLLGDFNLIRKPEDRNEPGGNLKMFLFNKSIFKLGLVEIPLQGRKFTWSKVQTLEIHFHLIFLWFNNVIKYLSVFFTKKDKLTFKTTSKQGRG